MLIGKSNRVFSLCKKKEIMLPCIASNAFFLYLYNQASSFSQRFHLLEDIENDNKVAKLRPFMKNVKRLRRRERAGI